MKAPTTSSTTRRNGRPGSHKEAVTSHARGRNGKPVKASGATPGDGAAPRVNAVGLVHLADEAVIAAVPLYYYAERGRWYGPNGHGAFMNLSDSQARCFVAEYGFHKALKDDRGNTPADRALLWLSQRHAVAYAGPLAGYPAGLHIVNGAPILVTESPRCLEPQPGAWRTISQLVTTLLADSAHDQVSVFLQWLSASYRAFRERMTTPGPWAFRFCPALALFGARGCGKTALIDLVLTPLLGGRRGDPMTYLRERRFNKDLFAGPLLVLDDKGAAGSLTERRERGEAIKDMIWKEEQRMEGKGADALMLRPFWRLVIAGNDDDAGLQVCPALSPSLADKLLLLRASPADGLPTDQATNDAWTRAIHSELPAFAAYLLTWQPPAGLTLDPRTRVVNFFHPALETALRDLQPEMRLLELIDSLRLIEAPATQWEGTATAFEQALRAKDAQGVLDRVFVASTSAGRLLSELARVVPDRVVRTNWSNTTHYRVLAERRKE